MSLMKQIKQRYSVRNYNSRKVEKDKLCTVLEAARLAPSAKNMQEWRFVVVQDAAMIEKLQIAANNQPFVGEAPVVIACCATKADYVMRCGQAAYPVDVAIAMEHMALQAVEEGLGTCWIGSFFENQVKSILGIPDNIRVVELMTLGYPAGDSKPANRLPMDKIVCYDTWKF